MNIVIYNGSTQREGNLDKVASILLNKFKGNNITYLKDEVVGCKNCGFCIKNSKCCINDSFPFQECLEADVILILSPIFFFDFSNKTKAFIDRLYCVPLENKIFTGIITSGSSYYLDSGIDIIEEIFYRVSRYCGSYNISPLNIITGDKPIEIEKTIITNFIEKIEEHYYENEKNKKCNKRGKKIRLSKGRKALRFP